MPREKEERKADEKMLKKLEIGDHVQYKNKTGVISKFTKYGDRQGVYGNRISYNYTSVTVLLDNSNKHITVSPRNLILLKKGGKTINKPLTCPDCGAKLELAVDVSGAWTRKINKNGQIGIRITKGVVIPNGAAYLKCPKCEFTYECEHASGDEPIAEFDEWIQENLNEIMDWAGM